MAAAGSSPNVIAKYLPVYFILLLIAAAEFFAAFRITSISTLLTLLLGLGCLWMFVTGYKMKT